MLYFVTYLSQSSGCRHKLTGGRDRSDVCADARIINETAAAAAAPFVSLSVAAAANCQLASGGTVRRAGVYQLINVERRWPNHGRWSGDKSTGGPRADPPD